MYYTKEEMIDCTLWRWGHIRAGEVRGTGSQTPEFRQDAWKLAAHSTGDWCCAFTLLSLIFWLICTFWNTNVGVWKRYQRGFYLNSKQIGKISLLDFKVLFLYQGTFTSASADAEIKVFLIGIRDNSISLCDLGDQRIRLRYACFVWCEK